MASKGRGSKRRSPARKDTMLRRIENTVGREQWASILNWSSDERAGRLWELLFDPAYQKHSMAKLSERVGLKSKDLLELFRRFHIDVAVIMAARHAPEVMKDVIEDALNTTVVCHRCDGKLQVQNDDGSDRVCPACQGKGTEIRIGDYRARRMVLESVGLLGQNRRPSEVQVQVNAAPGPSLEAVIARAKDILEGDPLPKPRGGHDG